MRAADHELLAVTTRHADATLRLVDSLRTARAWGYKKSPGSRVETAEGIDDPTGALATSTSRLALRARTIEALSAIETPTASFEDSVAALTSALDAHQSPHRPTRELAA